MVWRLSSSLSLTLSLSLSLPHRSPSLSPLPLRSGMRRGPGRHEVPAEMRGEPHEVSATTLDPQPRRGGMAKRSSRRPIWRGAPWRCSQPSALHIGPRLRSALRDESGKEDPHGGGKTLDGLGGLVYGFFFFLFFFFFFNLINQGGQTTASSLFTVTFALPRLIIFARLM